MKEIGQFFKDRLDQVNPEVPDQLWSNIQKSPDLQKFNRLSRLKRGMLYYATPFIAVTAIALVVWQFSSKKNTESNSVIEANQETKTILVSQQETINENTKSVEVTTPISEHKSNATSVINNNSKNDESVKTPNSTPTNTSTINNTIVTSPKTSPVEITNKQITSPVAVKKTEKSQVLEQNPKNSNNTTADQSTQSSASNSTTIPDTEKQLFIPNGFTPNNDGTNDQFFVVADWEVESFEMMIFNRGGGMVFKSSNIQQGWDGTSNNVEVPQGVYVYKIMYKNQYGDQKILKGTLTLIR